MKKIKLVSLAICALLLGSCAAPSDSDFSNSFTMTARISAVGDPLEVDVIEAPHGNSGPFFVLVSRDTEIVSNNNERIGLSDLSAGQVINITYGGQVMMSYPPKIVAMKIAVVE